MQSRTRTEAARCISSRFISVGRRIRRASVGRACVMSGARRGAASARPGTRMRGAMASAYEARGHAAADLYLVYSPKMQQDVVLTGRLQYFHFLLVERDPSIIEVDYAPFERLVRVAGEEFAALVAAELKTQDGHVLWRRLIDREPDRTESVSNLRKVIGSGPLAAVNSLEVLTLRQLVHDEMWTRNAHRSISWISAAREWPLAEYKSRVLTLIKERRVVTFDDCLLLGDGQQRALFGAAVLQMAMTGSIESDLGERPLTTMSSFNLARSVA